LVFFVSSNFRARLAPILGATAPTTDAMSKEASDVALNWCIELISMSEILEPESKYAILDALKDKISSGKFSPNTEVSEPLSI